MKDALYLLLVLVGLFVALVALSIGNRVRSWGRR
jgi:hypothetical protein